MRHLLSLCDLSRDEIERIFAISADLKSKLSAGVRAPLLPNRVAALLFEKPSLRTRVSCETAMAHLGGNSLFLGEDVGWGKRESTADFAHVLCEYVDVIVCRAKAHRAVEELAAHCARPVINGLTDFCHPCQALADLFTLLEIRGSLDGAKLAYVGDANNVARSLAMACGVLGVEMAIASPADYQFDRPFVEQLKADVPALALTETTDPQEAVAGANAVYTDVWTSMGQEAEQQTRQRAFANYQVDAALMSRAAADACFLHCLPARRGEEVSSEVMDSPHSAVMQQAGNRMHVQKGIFAWFLNADV